MRSDSSQGRVLIVMGVLLVLLLTYCIFIALVDSAKPQASLPVTPQAKPKEIISNSVQFAKDSFTGGIGVILMPDPVTGIPRVRKTIPGTPAEKAGLRDGDLLLEINGISTAGKGLAQVIDMLRGWTISSVNLLVQRGDTNFNSVIDRTSWNKLKQLGRFQ